MQMTQTQITSHLNTSIEAFEKYQDSITILDRALRRAKDNVYTINVFQRYLNDAKTMVKRLNAIPAISKFDINKDPSDYTLHDTFAVKLMAAQELVASGQNLNAISLEGTDNPFDNDVSGNDHYKIKLTTRNRDGEETATLSIAVICVEDIEGTYYELSLRHDNHTIEVNGESCSDFESLGAAYAQFFGEIIIGEIDYLHCPEIGEFKTALAALDAPVI